MKHRPYVVVVDDDDGMCRALERLLRAADFEVATFDCGRAALDAITRRPPACAVIDIELPDFRGLGLLEEMRAIGANMPVLVITAWEDDALRQRANEAGVRGFFYKPFSEEPFLECLHVAIAAR